MLHPNVCPSISPCGLSCFLAAGLEIINHPFFVARSRLTVIRIILNRQSWDCRSSNHLDVAHVHWGQTREDTELRSHILLRIRSKKNQAAPIAVSWSSPLTSATGLLIRESGCNVCVFVCLCVYQSETEKKTAFYIFCSVAWLVDHSRFDVWTLFSFVFTGVWDENQRAEWVFCLVQEEPDTGLQTLLHTLSAALPWMSFPHASIRPGICVCVCVCPVVVHWFQRIIISLWVIWWWKSALYL